ncbi:MAG: LON peptidase substrate-binding domain-containing protein [Acidobacteriota bacterium]
MLPSTIPIFPLPSVVLFPSVFLPLHIFEGRYRQMVSDALAGERLIGMTLLQPGYEADYEGRPPVYDIGCAGLITHAERLPDGRFNIVLQGLEKFRIVGEEDVSAGTLYRRALIAPLDDPLADADRDTLREERRKLEALLTPALDGALGEYRIPAAMPDEELINALAQYLGFEPVEQQALLERPGVMARCRSMIELLEMKALGGGAGGETGVIH